MSEASAPGVPVCYRHPGRESHIRCQRCERPICPECMTPASVGFQCPECVNEGRRTTRSPRTRYGGLIPRGGMSTSIVLIAVNVLVWLAINANGGQNSRLVTSLGLSPTSWCESLTGPCVRGVADGAWWQPLTSMFVHVTIGHIFFNMLNLVILGPQLESLLGRARFLAVYFIAGLAGSAMVCWIAPYNVTFGASGAIFGLMGAFLVLALRSRLDVPGMLIWIGISFAYSFAVTGISWQAHFGGFLGGAVAAGVIVVVRGARRRTLQWSGLGGVTLLAVLAIALRAAQLA